MTEQPPTDSHSPVNWRVRRNTGVADTLHVSTVNGAVRIGTRGIRLIIARDTALSLADHIVDAVEQLDQSPEADEAAPIDVSSAVAAAILDQLEDIHVELTEARIAAAAGDLVSVRAWLDLSEKVIGGRITEYKQARLNADSNSEMRQA